ncbi:MAG TPA: SurA N-terminal domain-containing protein [Pyrinomonadaceae bacterium]|nr:SurA N-terminal domain-containing protein [Pyrinomonadaceae bacterium]
MHRHAKRVASITLVIISALAVAACNRGANGKAGAADSASAAATVNGKPIPLKEVDKAISLQAGGQLDKLSPLELANARIAALQSLIQTEALFQRAEREKLLPSDEEVTQAINARKQQARMTEEEWQRRLKESGEDEQSLREKARRELAIQKLVEKTVGSITIRDNEVETFYNTNKARFVSPRGVGLSAIIVDPRDNSGGQSPDDAKNEQEAKSKIDAIYATLKSGTVDFAEVARNRSEDQSGASGGDLGFATEEQLRQNRFPAEIISGFFGSTPVGGITPPVRFEDGRFYIFKLTDRRLQSENQTLESRGVRDQIKDLLIQQRQKILTDALGVVAMNEAKIENSLAQSMLNDPNMLGGMQPVSGVGTSTPAGASSPAATATPAPAASATPAATAPAASPQATK